MDGTTEPGAYSLAIALAGSGALEPQPYRFARVPLVLNPVYRPLPDGTARLDWRGNARNRREFGQTPLPASIVLPPGPSRRELDALVRAGILVPDRFGRLGPALYSTVQKPRP
ncbi:MAG: hypothetical protein WDN44_03620 [Sphingomonas sp.]